MGGECLIDRVAAILLISPDPKALADFYRDAQSPVMVLGTSNVKAVAERLSANGVHTTGPTDHGFGLIVSFRDLDGNLVEVLEEHPTGHR
jgi:hypothetical protein